jgi:hypothetical protein
LHVIFSAKSELGRFPITDYIKTQAILYFFRLQTDLINPLLKAVDLGYPKMFPSFNFKKFHRAVFSIAHPKYSNFGGILDARMMVILVSEDSNRYAHLFLIEREYFGFNTLECCCWINMKYLAYLNILLGDNHVQNSGNCKKWGMPWGPPWY